MPVFHLALRSRYFCVCALVSVPRGRLPARAQQPVEPWKSPHLSLPAKDLYQAASAVSAPEGTNVVLLEDDESFTFDDSGRLTHVGYFVYKVLTQKGAEGWDAFSVGWQPWHQERPEIRVRVITSDLAEHLLDPKTITEGPAREGEYKIYSDAKRIRAPFPADRSGSGDRGRIHRARDRATLCRGPRGLDHVWTRARSCGSQPG